MSGEPSENPPFEVVDVRPPELDGDDDRAVEYRKGEPYSEPRKRSRRVAVGMLVGTVILLVSATQMGANASSGGISPDQVETSTMSYPDTPFSAAPATPEPTSAPSVSTPETSTPTSGPETPGPVTASGTESPSDNSTAGSDGGTGGAVPLADTADSNPLNPPIGPAPGGRADSLAPARSINPAQPPGNTNPVVIGPSAQVPQPAAPTVPSTIPTTPTTSSITPVTPTTSSIETAGPADLDATGKCPTTPLANFDVVKTPVDWRTLPTFTAGGGNPIYSQSFATASDSWPAGDDGHISTRYACSTYEAHVLQEGFFLTLPGPEVAPRSAEVVTATAAMTGGQGGWGVWCRGTQRDGSEHYEFLITHAGAVTIREPGAEPDWTYLSGVDVTAATTISALCADGPDGRVELALAVNGRQVLNAESTGTILKPGYAGISEFSFDDVAGPALTARFSEFDIRLPA